jgi:hypothetical protein
MIATGMFSGGPELHPSPINDAWSRVSVILSDNCPWGWVGNTPGIQVKFYVSGSVFDYSGKIMAGAVRASRKRRVLLVNVLVPLDVVHDFEKSFTFLLESLHSANRMAKEIFAAKKIGAFDFAKAESIVNQAARYLTDNEFRAGIEARFLAAEKARAQPLTGFSSEMGWTLRQEEVDGRKVSTRLNTAVTMIQGHPDLRYRLTLRVPLLQPDADGLPTWDESLQLDAIEECMVGLIEPNTVGYFVAATSTNGVRELMFYVRGPRDAEPALRAAEKVASGHRLESVVEEDKNWDAYKKLLQE